MTFHALTNYRWEHTYTHTRKRRKRKKTFHISHTTFLQSSSIIKFIVHLKRFILIPPKIYMSFSMASSSRDYACYNFEDLVCFGEAEGKRTLNGSKFVLG